MNKTIIVVIVLAIVAAGSYFLIRGQYADTVLVPTPAADKLNTEVETQPSLKREQSDSLVTQEEIQKENIVHYTNSGFEPLTLSVRKGETVIFKNESSQGMWTASAIHPTHRLYPTTGGCLGSTFDACAGIQPGSSWSFKFDISGTWKYHDHLHPRNIGTIVVQ